MIVRCTLDELLRSKGESQAAFAHRVGLARQTVQKLCSHRATGIEFATLEKLCRGLGKKITDVLVMDPNSLHEDFAEASTVRVALGCRRYVLGGAGRFAVGLEDMDALFSISKELAFRATKEQREVEWQVFPQRQFWDKSEFLECGATAKSLLLETQGILFIIGSDLVNGFASFALDCILNVGADTRGKQRIPTRMQLPFRMAWGHTEKKEVFMALDKQSHSPQGLWDVAASQLIVAVPHPSEAEKLPPDVEITDAVLIYIDPKNRHHPGCLLIGIAGFTGRGTAIAANQLFEMQHIEYLDKQLNSEGPECQYPLFTVARVTYTRDGRIQKIEFVKSSWPLPV